MFICSLYEINKMSNTNTTKSKKILYIIISSIIVILIAILIGTVYIEDNSLNIIDEQKLYIFYFYVGQADCTLIVNNGGTMLIDGGNEADSQNIIDYISNLGITKLDYIIATHADSDHIGGLDKIIQAFDVTNIFMPNTDKELNALTEIIEIASDRISVPSKNDIFYIGNSECTVVSIDDETQENVTTNNSSIVIQLDYNEISCLFMGDAETEVENSIIWEDIDVLKVAHHGSNDSTSSEFLDATKPEYSIISVGINNKFGHPSEETLERLKQANSVIYRTDEDGTIILISDGESYYFEFDETSLDGNV